MRYDAVLFDLDGTLLDTLADLAESMNRSLERFGFARHAVEKYRYFVGDGVEALAWRAAPAAKGDDRMTGQLVAAMREEYGRRWAETTRPYPGVPEMLDALIARGLALAVFSNKPHEFTELCVAKLLPRWQFRAVVGIDDGTPTKPNPTGALRIAERLGIAPARFVYLGDTGTDMRTAVAAGMYPVGATWGFRTPDELTEHGAEVLIDRPEDLLQLIGPGKP